MKSRKNIKGLIVIGIGLIGLITTLLVNSHMESDFICILLMVAFLLVEILGLRVIVKNKYQYRWGFYV